ncbi:desmocollin 2-like protein [Diadema antillarum]|uniref:desmocollin 2-like protein n=1 Tax=Diadema antillarum TaxID=105358 RepID=UPI003A858A40
MVSYTLFTFTHVEYFTVSAEGMVSLTAGNQVVNDVYRLTVSVQDRALEPLSNHTLVIIEVDIEPIIDPAAPYISKNCSDEINIEEEEEATVICFVTASSTYDEVVVMDMEDKSDNFDFDPNTGQIWTKGPIDFETDPKIYQLLIYAEGATSKLRNYTTITVMVDDINDNAPMFYGLKEFFVEEDGRGETDCNQPIGTVETTDADSKNNSDVVYQTDDPKFEVREEKLMSIVCLRREFHPERTLLTITAVNVGSDGLMNQTNSINVTVILEDVNDCPPTFDADDYPVVVSELVEGEDLWTGLHHVTDCDDVRQIERCVPLPPGSSHEIDTNESYSPQVRQ